MQHHKYSLTELENMMPWEREVYLTMLLEYIKEENRKQPGPSTREVPQGRTKRRKRREKKKKEEKRREKKRT